jgi:hypothetical protein
MAYSPEQYQLNIERIKAAQKKYYLKTRETRIAKQKAYDDAHRDQIRERIRKNRAANKIQVSIDVEAKPEEGEKIEVN